MGREGEGTPKRVTIRAALVAREQQLSGADVRAHHDECATRGIDGDAGEERVTFGREVDRIERLDRVQCVGSRGESAAVVDAAGSTWLVRAPCSAGLERAAVTACRRSARRTVRRATLALGSRSASFTRTARVVVLSHAIPAAEKRARQEQKGGAQSSPAHRAPPPKCPPVAENHAQHWRRDRSRTASGATRIQSARRMNWRQSRGCRIRRNFATRHDEHARSISRRSTKPNVRRECQSTTPRSEFAASCRGLWNTNDMRQRDQGSPSYSVERPPAAPR